MDSVVAIPENPNEYEINLTTEEIALFVWLETEVAGVFSDNGFHMIESKKTIKFQAREPTDLEKVNDSITIMSLYDTRPQEEDSGSSDIHENSIMNMFFD